jgi:hypothetical protein
VAGQPYLEPSDFRYGSSGQGDRPDRMVGWLVRVVEVDSPGGISGDGECAALSSESSAGRPQRRRDRIVLQVRRSCHRVLEPVVSMSRMIPRGSGIRSGFRRDQPRGSESLPPMRSILVRT